MGKIIGLCWLKNFFITWEGLEGEKGREKWCNYFLIKNVLKRNVLEEKNNSLSNSLKIGVITIFFNHAWK